MPKCGSLICKIFFARSRSRSTLWMQRRNQFAPGDRARVTGKAEVILKLALMGQSPGQCPGQCPISASSSYQTTLTRWLPGALPGVLMQRPDKPRRSHNCPQLCELVLCGRASLSLKTVPNSLRLKSPDCIQPRWTRRKLSPTWVWPVQRWERTL